MLTHWLTDSGMVWFLFKTLYRNDGQCSTGLYVQFLACISQLSRHLFNSSAFE